MENNATNNTANTFSFSGLFSDPSTIMDITRNPGKYAMNFYNSLSTRNKQYIAYGAGVGLIIYGYTLKNKK